MGSEWRCIGERLVCGFRMEMYRGETGMWVQNGDV